MTSPVGCSLRTLPAFLSMRAATTPTRLAYRFLRDEDLAAQELTYAALYQRASDIAHELKARTAKGARVLVMCPPGLDYVAGVWGCLIAERVAVPALPPRLNRSSARFETLLADALAGAALVTARVASSLQRYLAAYAHSPLDLIAVDAVPRVSELLYSEADADDLAILQYTSGSTSSPRGVMLTHANLLANCAHGAAAYRADSDSEVISWLPPYHDMGLIGAILWPMIVGCRTTMMSPTTFAIQPNRWLQAITRYRGTHSGAPDFAFAMCVRRVSEEQKQALDLSSWRVAWNGAERVRAQSIDDFCRSFGRVGFQPSAMRPCYGLAEATLMVAFSDHEGPTTFAASARALSRHQVAEAQTANDTHLLTSSGKVIAEHAIAIVEPTTGREQGPGLVGEIWVRGPSIPSGYFQRTEETERIFHARLSPDDGFNWMRTGDLGFALRDHLYVVGRLKDLLIVDGRKLNPDDIEDTAQSSHPALRPLCGAAFSVDIDGEERVCLVQEIDVNEAGGSAREQNNEASWEQAGSLLRAAVLAEHELVLHDVWLILPGQIPKTSSGKIQRSLAKRRYLEGEFETVLRKPASAAAEARRSRYEELVARECANLLGLATLDRDDDLLRLGAHSLIAMQLTARLEETLERRVSLRTLLEARTVARLALALEESEAVERVPPIEPQRAELLPLTPAQAHVWFEHAFAPASSAHNLCGALILRGPCQETKLAEALRRVVARHAILRTRYRYVEAGDFARKPNLDSGPIQEVLPAEPLNFSATDLPSLANAETHAERFARVPFDLSRDPVLRAHLFRVTPELRLFALVVHRIAADGPSLEMLIDEVFSSYLLAAGGSAPEPKTEVLSLPLQLGPPRISYLDYAQGQHAMGGLAAYESAVPYWKAKLAAAPPVSTFPADKSRPARPSLDGRSVKRTLPPTLVTALDAFCRELGVTRYMALLSVFHVLLMRSTGQSDLCIGTPVSGRDRAQTEGMLGTFVNMLAIRNQVASDLSFVQLVMQVRDSVLGALEHQAAPFKRVIEATSPARSQAYTPIFQVLFDYQVMRRLDRQLDALEIEPMLLNRGASRYDLGLSVVETSKQTYVHLEYSTGLFEHASASRIADRFVVLLESALLEPYASCGRLPWLLRGEQAELLANGRGPACSHSTSSTLIDEIESSVLRQPEAPAIDDGHESLSYGLLDARANRLAHHLRAHGVGPEVVVAVYLERSVELVVALLAILKAGGAYVPLDPVYPPARIALMLEDASPRVVITERALVASLPDGRGPTLVLEDQRAHLESLPPDAPARGQLMPHHLAYILFTSGSTGRPKGVEVTHSALHNFLTSMAREPGLSGDDLLLAVTTVSFDIAALELFLPLCVGARLEIASRAMAVDGVALSRRMARGDVTCLQATPATYRMLLEVGLDHHPRLKLLCGGEALPKDLADVLVERAGAGLFNMYGPTETTVWSSCARVAKGSSPIFLGHAIDNTFLYVLDEGGVPVPRGVAGELYIGGAGVARGYHRRPDLTSERFVSDPFESRGRMYRTGDAARFRHDGELEFLGRLDQQIKLRGFRVELGEIESQLLRLPGIEACAVKVFEVSPQDSRLVAYLVRHESETLSTNAIQTALRGQLPEYMVPSVYLELPALPLTPNGKVDRKALLLPTFAHESVRQYEPPRDELEASICQLFEEILGRQRVGLTDGFFDLGGHSILAVRLFERLAAQTGQRLALSTLFEASTPLDLGLLIRAKRAAEGDPYASCVVPLADTGQTPQLFCVHPDGSGTERALDWYRPLVGNLGMAAAAVSCDEDVYLELRELAARHVRALSGSLRKHALPRSLWLMGVGLGGNVAQEMAVQLEDAGVEIRRVIVIQSLVPTAELSISVDYLKALGPNLKRALASASQLLPHEIASRRLLWSRRVQRLLRLEPARAPALEDPTDLAALPACYQSLSAPQWNALLRHEARPCSAPITVIRAHRSGLVPLDEAHGFGALSLATVEARILDCSVESLLNNRFVASLSLVLREIFASHEQEIVWRPLFQVHAN